jgi:hypothetical protein
MAKLASWLGYQAFCAGWLDMLESLLAALDCLPSINVNLAIASVLAGCASHAGWKS